MLREIVTLKTQLKCCETVQDFNLLKDSVLVHSCESGISNISNYEIYFLVNRERLYPSVINNFRIVVGISRIWAFILHDLQPLFKPLLGRVSPHPVKSSPFLVIKQWVDLVRKPFNDGYCRSVILCWKHTKILCLVFLPLWIPLWQPRFSNYFQPCQQYLLLKYSISWR